MSIYSEQQTARADIDFKRKLAKVRASMQTSADIRNFIMNKNTNRKAK